jgi:hypothetical protein
MLGLALPGHCGPRCTCSKSAAKLLVQVETSVPQRSAGSPDRTRFEGALSVQYDLDNFWIVIIAIQRVVFKRCDPPLRLGKNALHWVPCVLRGAPRLCRAAPQHDDML